jgi:hypothetical protein
METNRQQIAVKAVNQLPKSVVREIRTLRSVGARGRRPPSAIRWRGEFFVPTATVALPAVRATVISWPSGSRRVEALPRVR